MALHQVTCIVKPNPESAVDRIQQLQGVRPDTGEGWFASPAVAAADILNGDTFYLVKNGKRIYLERVPGRKGAPDFVRTVPNGREDDNLLKMDQCQYIYREP